MKILKNNKDFEILLDNQIDFKLDLGWYESFKEYEDDALTKVINPIENYETVRYIHKSYLETTNVEQTDIWFYFYFLSGTTYMQNYLATGLSNSENAKMLKQSTESFFRLEFFKTPNNEQPTRNNRRLVATKTLTLPLGEKFFLKQNSFNNYIFVPVFMGSNYKNKENMYFFWFQDDSVLDETVYSGDTFYFTAKYFNAKDGTITDFTNTCMLTTDEIVEQEDMYYQLVIDKTDYSYQVYEYTGATGNRIGKRNNPIKFYEKGGGDCQQLLASPTPTPTPTITPSITPSKLVDVYPTPTPTPSSSNQSSQEIIYTYNISSVGYETADIACEGYVNLDDIIYSKVDFGCGSLSPYIGQVLFQDTLCQIPWFGATGLYHRISKVGCSGYGSIARVDLSSTISEGCYCQAIGDSTCYVAPPPDQPNIILLCQSDISESDACSKFQPPYGLYCTGYFTAPYDTELKNGVIIYTQYPNQVAPNGYYSNGTYSWYVAGNLGVLNAQTLCPGVILASPSITPSPSIIQSVTPTPTPSPSQQIIIPPLGANFTLNETNYTYDLQQPFKGTHMWLGEFLSQITYTNPTDGSTYTKSESPTNTDYYWRFDWNDIDTSISGTTPRYEWYYPGGTTNSNGAVPAYKSFNNIMQQAINNGGKLNFAIMMAYDIPTTVIPQWFRNLGSNFVRGAPTCGGTTITEIPNWNSSEYITALTNLLIAVRDHIETNGWKNNIGYIDIRSYGNFGEWHTYAGGCSWPAQTYQTFQDSIGFTPQTTEQWKALVQAYLDVFYDYRLVMLIGGLIDANGTGAVYNGTWFSDFAEWCMQQSTNKGGLGIRIDHYFTDSSTLYTDIIRGDILDNIRSNMWKNGPIVGEPNANTQYISTAAAIVTEAHVTSFGNGNSKTSPNDFNNPANYDYVMAASKAAGYKISVVAGYVPDTMSNGDQQTFTLYWKNTGCAPVYENWSVKYEIRTLEINGDSLVATYTSNFQLKHWIGGSNLPDSNSYGYSDIFTITGIPIGTYNIILKIIDPLNFWDPFVLNNFGANNSYRRSDGGYLLKTITIIS